MNQQAFEQRYHRHWESFEAWLAQQENGAPHSATVDSPAAHQADIPRLYRQLCHHLSLARERRYGSLLIDRLHTLVLRGHQELYSSRSSWVMSLGRFLVFEFPHTVRCEARLFWMVCVLFYGSGLLMYLAVSSAPDIVYTMMDPHTAATLETMYAPDNERIGRERGSESDAAMFGYYIRNNIGIAFQTFAGGLLFTLGTLFYLVFNGLFFGAVAGHLTQLGYTETFYSFVIGHGSFELTAIVIAGVAGLRLGLALLRPGRLTRADALRAAARISARLIAGAAVMLVFAAFIEAFWSSTQFVPASVKYVVGAGLWLSVVVYLVSSGRSYAA